MLNLTRLHLGIAHESQFQGLGITAQSQSQGGYLLLNCKGKSFNLASKGHFAAILVIELRRLWNIDPRPIGLTPA